MCSHWRPRIVLTELQTRAEAISAGERITVRTMVETRVGFDPIRPEPGHCSVHGCDNHTHDEKCLGGNFPIDQERT